MHITSLKNYKAIHTWTGIIASLFLFVVFVAGAFTMFQAPLNRWVLQDESRLPEIDHRQYDQLIQEVLTTHPEAHSGRLLVNLPSSMPKSAPVTWEVEDESTHTMTYWQASLDKNGELITANTSISAIGSFLDHIHRTAGIPGQFGHEDIGTLIMGVVSALYLLALISGLIVFLPTWRKDALTLRKGKNSKRFWLDFHNVLGITSLPFHIIIALTTITFAFHDPIYGAMRSWAYGDHAMFSRLPSGEPNRPVESLASISQLEASIKQLQPELEVSELLYSRLQSPSPSVRIGGRLPGYPVRGAELTYAIADPFSAKVGYASMLPNQADTYSTVVGSFFALHFGNYGGDPVRWLYFILGVGGAAIFLSGNILWIESRHRKQQTTTHPNHSRSNVALSRLTVGVCGGTLLGILAAIGAAKFLNHKSVDIVFWQQAGYYTGFFSAILWAYLRPPLIAAQDMLITISAMIFISLLTWCLNPAQDYEILALHLLLLMLSIAVLRWLKHRRTRLSDTSVWLHRALLMNKSFTT